MRMAEIFLRDSFLQLFFHFKRGFPGRDPGSVADAEKMGIDGDCRLSESDVEDDICRLPADTGEFFQLFPGLRDGAVVITYQRLAQLDDIFGLGFVKTDGFDIIA